MATDGVGATGSSSSSSGTSSTKNNANTALQNIDVDQFLKLMISELQNQDPLNPMDNAQMIEQIGTLRAIAANTKLTDTLDSVMLSQNLSSAGALLGKSIKALADDGTEVMGTVSKVSVVDNVPKLTVGDKTVLLKNIREILPTAAAV